jgi:hypothetical protein
MPDDFPPLRNRASYWWTDDSRWFVKVGIQVKEWWKAHVPRWLQIAAATALLALLLILIGIAGEFIANAIFGKGGDNSGVVLPLVFLV